VGFSCVRTGAARRGSWGASSIPKTVKEALSIFLFMEA
jgi:hypothetical protein